MCKFICTNTFYHSTYTSKYLDKQGIDSMIVYTYRELGLP